MGASGWWTTWSRISASWSTSEPGPTIASTVLGWVRLTHPFPSVLDGVVSGIVAGLAGGSPGLAIRIGVAMTLLQLGIGTVNDLVDARLDAGLKLGKPIPAGLVGPRPARLLAATLFGGGVLLAATVSTLSGALAGVVIAIGLAYDLRLKGTAWSWLPFAVGIPVLPIFGWVGVTGSLDPAFAVIVPVAVAAGAALAIGNALVDLERDEVAGASSIAVALGPRRASRVATALLVAVASVALVTAALASLGPEPIAAIGLAGAVPALAAFRSGSRPPDDRERAWQAEAVGLAILAALWLAAVMGTGRPRG